MILILFSSLIIKLHIALLFLWGWSTAIKISISDKILLKHKLILKLLECDVKEWTSISGNDLVQSFVIMQKNDFVLEEFDLDQVHWCNI